MSGDTSIELLPGDEAIDLLAQYASVSCFKSDTCYQCRTLRRAIVAERILAVHAAELATGKEILDGVMNCLVTIRSLLGLTESSTLGDIVNGVDSLKAERDSECTHLDNVRTGLIEMFGLPVDSEGSDLVAVIVSFRDEWRAARELLARPRIDLHGLPDPAVQLLHNLAADVAGESDWSVYVEIENEAGGRVYEADQDGLSIGSPSSDDGGAASPSSDPLADDCDPAIDAPQETLWGVVPGVGPDAPIITNARGGKQSHILYRLDLLPALATLAVARVLYHGAAKYGDDNWRSISTREHLNHLLLHVLAWLAGDRQDDHLDHMACRALMALEIHLTSANQKEVA